MPTYKPEGATHFYDFAGRTGWYKRCELTGQWLVWWPAKLKWAESVYDDEMAALVLRPIVSDTGANQ